MGGDFGLAAPAFPWHHKTPLAYSLFWRPQFIQGHDWASVRRGRQIYTEVFAPCHSLDLLCFRHLQEFMTTEEVKALAADCEVTADPDDEGNVGMREAGLLDKLPQPYPNAKAASFSNNGANPPDLSHITKGRDGGENYIHALLTSYGRDAPAGLEKPSDSLNWNPYFLGGWIGMPRPLSDEQVEYDDGTPASVAQMSKDVSCFLAWCAEPWMDERKYLFTKGAVTFATLLPFGFYWFRTRNGIVKNRRLRRLAHGSL
eukprot:TRINITY_DN38374_c0_g1_i1.p2 TRINITY_DN38374_c0_g1~~TRINITY_DN38374_c0_g1_i1.p2  ORF type:complete len:258 (+),score=85.51 TRINITY_DN38374_c0_g1_i1:46-819(+)